MAVKKTGLTLPLPVQFLAAWLAAWIGRVLQEQVEYLKAENQLLREKLGGIDPAPGRGSRMPWAKFIKAHLGVLVGMDFFTLWLDGARGRADRILAQDGESSTCTVEAIAAGTDDAGFQVPGRRSIELGADA